MIFKRIFSKNWLQKVRFFILQKIYWTNLKIRYKANNIIFNFKYFPRYKKITSNLNFKAFLVIFITFLILAGTQIIFLSFIFKPSLKPENLKKYIFEHQNYKIEIENKLNENLLKCSELAKSISVPFYLNRISFVQKKLELYFSSERYAENYFTFNHLGRLLNLVPFNKKYWQHISTYTPYIKYLIPKINEERKTILYFYLDNPLIISNYKLKEGTYIYRHKFYNMEPFQHSDEFLDSKKEYSHKFLSEDAIFNKSEKIYTKIPYILFLSPIFNQVNRFIGFYGFTISIEKILEEIFDKYNHTFNSIIINKYKLLIYYPDTTHIGEYLGNYSIINRILNSSENILILGPNKIYFKERINNTEWFLISKLNVSLIRLAFADKKVLLYSLILLVIQLAIFILLFLIFKNKITQKIERFSNYIKELLEGRPRKQVSLDNAIQFKVLEHNFNKLSERVASYIIFGKSMPYEIVDNYLNQNIDKIKEQHKEASILYIKIKNIEALRKEYLDNELKMLLERVLNDFEVIITKYKGFIEYFSNDSLIAIFGIPFNHYDHIRNSVESAKSIYFEIKRINRFQKVPLMLSMSIHTGEVSFAQLRSNYGKLFVSVGDVIKDAQIIESFTQPYVMAISERVYEKVSPYVKVNNLVTLRIKDKLLKVYLSKLKE